MKILLICVAGMSTSLVTKRIQEYIFTNQLDIKVEAHSVQEYKEHIKKVDVILLGPQISYKLDVLIGECDLPIGVIQAFDYGTANAEAIIKTAKELIE